MWTDVDERRARLVTSDGVWNPAGERAASVSLPLSDDDLLDAIEEVEVTEELVVVAPDRMVSHALAHDEPAGPVVPAEIVAKSSTAQSTSLHAARHSAGEAVDSAAEAGEASAVALGAVAGVATLPAEERVENPDEVMGALAAATPAQADLISPLENARHSNTITGALPPLAPDGEPAAAPASSHARIQRGAAQAVLLGAFGLDALLYMLVVPFLPSRAQSLGASPFVTSALFAMYAACLFAATPALGWLSDRLGARRVLLMGLAALAAATLAFAYAPGLPLLFAARGAQGVAAAATWTAGLALVAQLTPLAQRPKVFSRILMANGVGTLVGPPLGGLLYMLGGFSAPFLVVAALVVLDGCGRVLFLPGSRVLGAAQISAGRRNGALVKRDSQFVFALLVTLAGAGLLAMAEPSIPLVLSTHFGVEPVVIGLVFGGVALVFILFQPLVAAVTRWVGAERAVAFGLVMSAGALMLEATSATALQAELGLIHLALGLSLILLPALEVLTRSGQKRAVAFGTLFAAYNLAYAGGQLVGPLIAGATITAAGPAQGFALLSLIPAVLGFVLLWRSTRRQPFVAARADESRATG